MKFGKGRKVDADEGGVFLIDIASLILRDESLYHGYPQQDKKLEEVQDKVRKMYSLTLEFLKWAMEMRKSMPEPFTEHAFIFKNVVNLYDHYYKYYMEPHVSKASSRPKFLIPPGLISEEEEVVSKGKEQHDGFYFAQTDLCKDWEGMKEEKKLESKAIQFVGDVNKLKEEALGDTEEGH